MQRYHSYRSYLKNKFGKPVLKIPINGGFSCPNRDGTKSSSGCSFCDNRSFSPAALKVCNPLQQLHGAIAAVRGKNDCFIPYLQPFSNTYGTVDRLRKIYEPLISVPGVCGLAIGTRPDCFSDDIFEYLHDLSKRTYLSVEVGLQSGTDRILSSVNRGHTVAEFVAVVNRLSEDRIETVAHCMLGFPGETESEMLETAKLCASLPLSGVKVHQLMAIEGTALAEQYASGLFEPFTLSQYAEIVCKFIAHLRPDQHIHRLVADSKRAFGLIAPLWSEDKAGSMRAINEYMNKHDIVQGCLYKK